MSDVQTGTMNPQPTPPCPVCGGETFLSAMHAAVARVTDVFRCRRCDVTYQVVRKPPA
jgi:hypothetical protein